LIIATIDPSIGINGYCDRTLDQDEFLSVVEKLFQAADRITMARSTRRNSEARLAALSFGCSPFDTDESCRFTTGRIRTVSMNALIGTFL